MNGCINECNLNSGFAKVLQLTNSPHACACLLQCKRLRYDDEWKYKWNHQFWRKIMPIQAPQLQALQKHIGMFDTALLTKVLGQAKITEIECFSDQIKILKSHISDLVLFKLKVSELSTKSTTERSFTLTEQGEYFHINIAERKNSHEQYLRDRTALKELEITVDHLRSENDGNGKLPLYASDMMRKEGGQLVSQGVSADCEKKSIRSAL